MGAVFIANTVLSGHFLTKVYAHTSMYLGFIAVHGSFYGVAHRTVDITSIINQKH